MYFILNGFRFFIKSGPIRNTNTKYALTIIRTGQGLPIKNHFSTSLPVNKHTEITEKCSRDKMLKHYLNATCKEKASKKLQFLFASQINIRDGNYKVTPH